MSFSKSDWALAVLRVSSSFMMLGHGWPKLTSFAERSDSFPDPLGMGSTLSLTATVGTEVGCALLVLLGIGTRIFAAPLLFTMLVAAFVVHAGDPFQKKELSLLYASVYVLFLLVGGGRIGLGKKFPKLAKYS